MLHTEVVNLIYGLTVNDKGAIHLEGKIVDSNDFMQ